MVGLRYSHVVGIVLALAASNAAAQPCPQTRPAEANAVIALPYASPGIAPEIGDVLALADFGDYRGGFDLAPGADVAAIVQRRMLVEQDRYQYDIVLTPLRGGGVTRVIAEAGGFLLQQQQGGPDGTSRDRRPVWSPDGRRVAFLVGCGGVGRLGIYDVERRRLRTIAPGGDDVHRFSWTDAATLSVETGPTPSALSHHEARVRGDGFAVDDDFAPLAFDLPYHSPRRTWSVDATTLRARVLDEAPDAAVPRQTSAPRAWIAPADPASRVARPPQALFHQAAGGSEATRCAAAACQGPLTGAWASADGADVYYLRRDGYAQALPGLYAWTVASNTIRLVRREEETLANCQSDGRALYCVREATTAPPAFLRIDFGDGHVQTLYDPNPDWRHFALPRVARIETLDAFGEESFAHLVYPASYDPQQRYPLVIVQYRSRGFLRGGVGGEYPIWPLAARGFFVLSVDRPEPRQLHLQLTPAELSRTIELGGSENRMKQSALEAMIAQLTARNLIDPGRIAITGLSDGAETVYFGLFSSEVFATAVASSPPTDALDWWLNAESFRRSRALSLGMRWPEPGNGDEPWSRWWRANSAALQADRITAPLLMQYPDNEALSGFPLYARLRQLNRPVDLYVYPDEYHLKWRPRHIGLVQTRAIDWIEFWFKGVERADPIDPNRAARWRALRQAQDDAAR